MLWVVAVEAQPHPRRHARGLAVPRRGQLDDLWHAQGRNPREVTRSYLAGFADEVAFSSVDAFDEVTGRLVDAGADVIVYYYMSDAQDDLRAAGPRWVDRSMLERLIGDGRWAVLTRLRHSDGLAIERAGYRGAPS